MQCTGKETSRDEYKPITYKTIAEALFDNYESIYDINLDTHEFKTYYQSENYQELSLARRGDDFFRALPKALNRLIHPDDCEEVLRGLQKETLQKAFDGKKYYTLIYRIMSEGKSIYHQLRAIRQPAGDGIHVLMGIKNIDSVMQYQAAHEEQIRAMKEKEHNHIEAVLASAAGYIEANLTDNIVLERSISRRNDPEKQLMEVPPEYLFDTYDGLQKWITDHLIVHNQSKYSEVSSSAYLLNMFWNGEKRASVLFTSLSETGGKMECRAVFYLYKEETSGNVHVFSVIYDLTEQQRKEKEREELETALQNSRIRNSTSQMQPHFLYNALGSIQEVILIDPKYASDLLGDFTVHLRSCVRAMASDAPIRFAEELKNIKAYVNIEKMRLGKKLSVVYDVETMGFDVLPLSIQPIVENAIRHGIHNRGKAGGTVILRTREEADGWIVKVEDNGIGFDTAAFLNETEKVKKDSTGIHNIRFRLETIMGAKVEFDSKVGKGTTVTVRIPRRESTDESDNR